MDSHKSVRRAVPCLLRTMAALWVKVTALSASHRGSTPDMLCRNPGIRCPLVGNTMGDRVRLSFPPLRNVVFPSLLYPL